MAHLKEDQALLITVQSALNQGLKTIDQEIVNRLKTARKKALRKAPYKRAPDSNGQSE
ncbi:DUF3619 family protein [Pseudomonadota bacterium]